MNCDMNNKMLTGLVVEWADALELTIKALHHLDNIPLETGVQLCAVDVHEGSVHIYRGIYTLAKALGVADTIQVRIRSRQSYKPWEHSFVHNGVTFYEIRESIVRGDNHGNE